MGSAARFLSIFVVFSLGLAAAPKQAAPPVYRYRVIHSYPHDPGAFTQGLIFLDGFLYESTGLNGRSSLRSVNLETGRVIQRHDVPQQFFAEGLTNWGSHLIQLTWHAQTAFVYDKFTFRQEKLFQYAGEGWGLTQDGKHLILSDGSPTIRFLDPATFQVVRQLKVTDAGTQVENINELEYVRGQIYANIWQTDGFAIISPQTGNVTAWLDISG